MSLEELLLENNKRILNDIKNRACGRHRQKPRFWTIMGNGTHLTMIVYPALIAAYLSGFAQRL
ncbi:hypothetical protein GW737_27135 [Escherichia coli]|nr:hypothetical protein [Escherichia coli]